MNTDSITMDTEMSCNGSENPKGSEPTAILLDRDQIDVVLYHGSCYDGFGSAFVVWYYYMQTHGLDRANQLAYIPCYHSNSTDIRTFPNQNVLMVDFSYKYDQLNQLISSCKTFMILDHHKTAEAELANVPSHLKVFDMNRSGVGITWDYFFPGQPIPRFLAHIQDRDLWRYELDQTDHFITYFYERPFDFNLWLTYLADNVVDEAIQNGKQWTAYKLILIKTALKKTSIVIQEIDNTYQIVAYVNSNLFKSDIGDAVMNAYPLVDFVMIWDYDLYKNQTVCSLRSNNKRTDVSVIARKFGGGGHRNASGLAFDSLVGCLPFKMIGPADLLLHCTKSYVMLEDVAYTYSLFKLDTMLPTYLEENYLDLIKRKCEVSSLIAFQVKSEQIAFVNDEIVPMYDYHIFYNEKYHGAYVGQLTMLGCMSREHCLSISSDKSFDEIFHTKSEPR